MNSSSKYKINIKLGVSWGILAFYFGQKSYLSYLRIINLTYVFVDL